MNQLVLFLGLFSFISIQLSAQTDCKVLNPKIDSIYIGKCKKGLAHGKGIAFGIDSYEGKFNQGLPNGQGTYTWKNGDTYTGSWKLGMQHGEGTFILKMAERDSILDGLWEDDKYVGPKPIAPRVISKVGVDRFSIKPSGGIKERVLINILQNGTRNTSISNFSMSTSNGVETELGNQVGYDFIEFPVRIRVSYMTMNKLKTQEYQVIFEFEISEPGDWLVDIHN